MVRFQYFLIYHKELIKIGSGHGDLVGVVGLPDAMTSAQITALLIAEMQVSFILCLSTNLVVGNKNWDMPVATLMIGLCVFTGIMAGHMSGAGAMNPARVLGPAILAGMHLEIRIIFYILSRKSSSYNSSKI